MTLYEALARARARLAEAGISEADASLDVDLYARTILGWDKARLLIEQQSPVPGPLEPTLSEWIERRILREPTGTSSAIVSSGGSFHGYA